jgi:tRNA pseudouridine38-40 synthase
VSAPATSAASTRYKLLLEYDGTDFHGWQVQANSRSVQGELERAVTKLLGVPTNVRAAGRTDAGVHATGQVASFTSPRAIEPRRVLRALNALTPTDLAVRAVETVAPDFDPRRHARQRRYVYRIWIAPWRSPFWRRYSWHITRPLDHAAMATAARAIVGEHDFSTFRAASCDASGPVRRMVRSEITVDDVLLTYTIAGNAFLRHMVRSIVGTLVDVGHGRRPATDVARLLALRDRNQAGDTAPPMGLTLDEVSYEEPD